MSCVKASGTIYGRLSAASGTIEPLRHAIGELRDRLRSASGKVVCAISDAAFLRVTPKDVQWITDYTSATFEVRSNVGWIVEY